MKAFIFVAVVACATADPQVLLNTHHNLGYSAWGVPQTAWGYNAISATPVVQQQIVAPLATKTQYHAQDELGQASYGYAYPGQASAAVRDAAGNVRGSYAYINPNGKEVRVEYTAGHDGFRVASNDLPVGPAPVAGNLPVANLIAPQPVHDTPEVAHAKAAHALAHQEALARSGRKKRQAVWSTPAATSPLAYTNVIAASPYAATYGYGYGLNSWNNGLLHNGVVATGYSNLVGTQAVVGTHLANANVLHATGYSNVVATAPAVAHQNLREATLTKVVNNPGHAVSYRVD